MSAGGSANSQLRPCGSLYAKLKSGAGVLPMGACGRAIMPLGAGVLANRPVVGCARLPNSELPAFAAGVGLKSDEVIGVLPKIEPAGAGWEREFEGTEPAPEKNDGAPPDKAGLLKSDVGAVEVGVKNDPVRGFAAEGFAKGPPLSAPIGCVAAKAETGLFGVGTASEDESPSGNVLDATGALLRSAKRISSMDRPCASGCAMMLCT
jgi:hypothetical protein